MIPLDQAIAVLPSSDWELMLQTLQNLPITGRKKELWNLKTEEWEKAQKICLGILKEGDFQTKWEVCKLYPKLGNEAIAALGDLLTAETTEDQCRWFVLRLLGDFDHLDSILILVKFLYESEDEELLSLAYQSLTKIGKPAIEALGVLINESEHRLLGVKALAQIRHPQTIPYLLRVVHDPSAEIRTLAVESLGSFRDPEILEILLGGLTDSASSVRKEVVIALALAVEAYPQVSKVQMINYLKPLLYDVDLSVSQQTISALGRIGDNEAAEALFPLLKSPATPNLLKCDVVRALSWINTASALNYLEEGLRWNDQMVCQEIINVLGRTEIPALQIKASQIIVNFYYSQAKSLNNTNLKRVIAFSLGELKQITALDCLTALSEEQEPTVRLHAVAAMNKLSKTT
jgi:HEAT repeat protein